MPDSMQYYIQAKQTQNEMKIIHTSPCEITSIDPSGMFDDCLFFSINAYSISAVRNQEFEYSIEIDDAAIINVGGFFYNENAEKLDSIVSEVMALVGCDEDDAEEILSDRKNVFNFEFEDAEDASEASWKVQALQGKAAKILGFEAAQGEDEQGSVYIVPMLGREADLVLA